MEEQNNINKKLLKLYRDCVNELKSIGIDVEKTGEISIKISNRSKKRYGCCKQEQPDMKYCQKIRNGRKIIVKCNKFNVHNIEISRWVMDLNEHIIKNTIIHELIHCFPYCNDHGEQFKKYAKIINEKLGYNISRVGNKEQDYKESNIEYTENKPSFRYEIICSGCGQRVFRQRLSKNFTRKYRCGKCGGKFKIFEI